MLRPYQQGFQVRGSWARPATSFYCEVCEKEFRSQRLYEDHIDEQHHPCSYPGCKFSGPDEILQVHELTHVKAPSGKSVLECENEIARWRHARRANFPGRQTTPEEHTLEISLLEKSIREKMSPNKNDEKTCVESAILPNAGRLTAWEYDSENENLVEDVTWKQRFCSDFIESQKCTNGKECRLSHNLKKYKQLENHKRKNGSCDHSNRIRKRPSLLYRLLLPDILKYEKQLLQALQYIVDKKFFEK